MLLITRQDRDLINTGSAEEVTELMKRVAQIGLVTPVCLVHVSLSFIGSVIRKEECLNVAIDELTLQS